ncbi:hypothetical protein LIER_21820 [Lithospermum erythrorhizon]|uniref:Reverse transcriptase zinc-binding domain-containing protein n=1 Tax=Lithospermum erythrorhizon TaxID=34254 RepID=A0AAV3QV11_LITER
MFDWNQVCLCKLLWNIASRKETLWVQWVHMHDNWCSLGPVWDVLNSQERVGFLLRNDVTLKDTLPLRFPSLRRRTLMVLRVASEASLISFFIGKDFWMWKDAVDGLFSLKSLWGQVRHKEDKVPGGKWFWSRYGIPRHEFISWMLFHYKLPTRDRLVKYGMQVDTCCVFCGSPESQDHLSFIVTTRLKFGDWCCRS